MVDTKSQEGYVSRAVLLFFLCVLLLTANGRLASYDAGGQLKESLLLARTGHLGLRNPPRNWDLGLWVQSPNGAYYEAHDIGNVLLMFPSAFIGSLSSGLQTPDLLEALPTVTRVLVSLTYAILCAFSCFFMFRLFLLLSGAKDAFLLTCAFIAATFFWAYTKSAWDVVGACCFVCMLLRSSALLLEGQAPRSNLVWSWIYLAAAASFRYSLLPFLALSLGLVVLYARSYLRLRDYALAVGAFLTLMTPTLLYNLIRMGSVFRPATTMQKYAQAGTADLSGNLANGLWGLLFSPNRGLFSFSPILILGLAFPFVWGKLSPTARRISMSYGLGALLYTCMLAKLRGWGTFGWGPRYLLPVLPIIFYPTGLVLSVGWKRYKITFALLLVLSAAVSIPPAFVNWSLAIAQSPKDLDPNAKLPYEQISVWKALSRGLRGESLSTLSQGSDDPVRKLGASFPDMWTIYLIRASHRTYYVGILLTLILVLGAFISCRSVIRAIEWQ